MCGITGFISREKTSPVGEREALLDRMCRIMEYRGPDAQGTVVRDRAALGMRRLAIIDLAGGQQPIYNDDRTLAIVFNGEIYNYAGIKKELEARGHRFRTNSDTETILRAFEEYGPAECLEKLRGMFAFAIWNFRDESLFVARDRVGKKPLFYSLTDDGDFVFGSELKTLLTHGRISREIDFAAMDAYLTFGYVPEEHCIFKSVRKLAPAHYLVFQNGAVRTEKYWDFDLRETIRLKTEAECVEALREKIKEAVDIRLISEVPLGAFLSGGVDSSTVVGMMAQSSSRPVKTFSIGFNEDSFDELKYARTAARHFGTEHQEFIVTPDLVDLVDEIVWHFDEPFSDPSSLPTYMVSKMAREFVTVVLSGDGGDELFGGYTRYVIDRQRSGFAALPRVIRRGVMQPLSEKLPHGARGKNFLYNVSLDALDRYIDSVSHFNRPRKKALYTEDFTAVLDGVEGASERDFKALAEQVPTAHTTDKLLYLDSKTYLPGDILTKVDRMSMANSLEARAPLLDHKLIEFVAGLPLGLKIKGTETKYILKKAMEGIVPREILYREKQGFGVPISEWINRQLRARIHRELLEAKTLERGYFKASYIATLLDEHARGRRDHSYKLWLLWVLELWHRRYVDR